ADETRRQVGQPCFHLPARPLLPKHDCATFIVPHHVKRILADIDTDHGDCRIELVWHGVLLVFGAPFQLPLLAGPEHGRTIPLADMGGPLLLRCAGLTCYTLHDPWIWGQHDEAARVHYAPWRGSDVAAGGARGR